MGEGREGDWECSECRNRNYAFRSLCNRCKQPRLLVDKKTPVDSKWLPRIGDWICAGCSNNNYASREVCKKCGQSKEEAAMPTIAVSGAALPTYANYFARVQGLLGLKMNYGMTNNSAALQSFPPNSNWSIGGIDKYALQSWSSAGNSSGAFSYPFNRNQLPEVPEGWRNGDWICDCGFHNYSSRSQCKQCNAPLPSGMPSSEARSSVSGLFPTLGTKRLASEEFVNEWDNKRLHAGDVGNHFLVSEQLGESSYDEARGLYSRYSSCNMARLPPMQANIHPAQLAPMPPILGKGAKQWRDGDWMCTSCNNHNFASRSFCNRCKTEKESAT
ncbi:uncharacterized protein A4U43_C01F14510 [Asparagus officinalis]|uniref:RanBP2-type domain-containing protein n=1 Tax=Asparagus officinalis TaxID=4686 RepID=A0A5P1FPJ8_ASPOF|nr:E3 SUMO-protein ligase RanBP2 [Asparagus officinalis]ONK80158.1 uncharacterized protein A4U43_C01F14510 [Asparagus officinalis]